MKIALAQLNFTVGDIKANASKIIAAINEAKQQGADLAVFAEFAVSGTPAYGLLTKTTFLTLCEEFNVGKEKEFADNDYIRSFASVSDAGTISDFVNAVENKESKTIIYMAGEIKVE